jgi:hypothetical protein
LWKRKRFVCQIARLGTRSEATEDWGLWKLEEIELVRGKWGKKYKEEDVLTKKCTGIGRLEEIDNVPELARLSPCWKCVAIKVLGRLLVTVEVRSEWWQDWWVATRVEGSNLR